MGALGDGAVAAEPRNTGLSHLAVYEQRTHCCSKVGRHNPSMEEGG